jgi:hypothetical protein
MLYSHHADYHFYFFFFFHENVQMFKVLPVNSEVQVHLKNIESPDNDLHYKSHNWIIK